MVLPKTTTPRNYFFRRRSDGLIEKVSKEEDKLLGVQQKAADLRDDDLYDVKMDDGSIIKVEKGINADRALMHLKIPFSWVVVDLIIQRVVDGESLTKICKSKDMPSYSTFCSWQAKYPEIKDMLRQARVDAAENHFHKAIEHAESATDKDDTPAQRLKSDVHKWAAQALNNEQFGNKTKVEGNIGAPVQIIFDTGIRRKEDYNKDQACYDERDVTPRLGDTSGSTVKADVNDSGEDDNGSGDA